MSDSELGVTMSIANDDSDVDLVAAAGSRGPQDVVLSVVGRDIASSVPRRKALDYG